MTEEFERQANPDPEDFVGPELTAVRADSGSPNFWPPETLDILVKKTSRAASPRPFDSRVVVA